MSLSIELDMLRFGSMSSVAGGPHNLAGSSSNSSRDLAKTEKGLRRVESCLLALRKAWPFLPPTLMESAKLLFNKV